jgi:hypothetical protein
MSDFFVESERRRQKVDQTKENSARLARCAVTYTTVGYGVVVLPQSLDFDVTFLTEPGVTTGVALASGERLRMDEIPRVCAGVYSWTTSPKGFYVGAHLWFVVEQAGVGMLLPGRGYTLHHHLVFDGIAIKDLPLSTMGQWS